MLIKDIIRGCFPKIEDYPFMLDLRNGMYEREDILKAEIVEIYRAKYTRDKIQEIYKAKLRSGVEDGIIDSNDFDVMEEVIDDEGETEEHIDHFDMRFKLYTGTRITSKSDVQFNEDCETINKEWVRVCEESSLLYFMAAMAGIEDWYAPISEFFEVEYGKRGFNEEELELFIVHKGADVDHSEAQFDILQRNSENINSDKLKQVVSDTFRTSVAYDVLKQKFAQDKDKALDNYIR